MVDTQILGVSIVDQKSQLVVLNRLMIDQPV